MSAHTIKVSGVSPTTTEKALHDFFGFCGSIRSIDHTGTTAQVHFEKASAAKTALMLNGGTLEGSHLQITSDAATSTDEDHGDHHEGFDQSDKPRAGIAAEYLAKGYTLSDQILERAIALDNQHGISTRFLNYVNSLDATIGQKALGPEQTVSGKVTSTVQAATERAKSVDEQKGFSKTAHDYYAKALASPLGQKVKAFYTTTSKQILDIHDEARRIADDQKANTATSEPAPAPVPVAKTD